MTLVLLKSKQNAKFFDFQDDNRQIFVVLSGRFQNLFRKKERFWRLVVTATISICRFKCCLPLFISHIIFIAGLLQPGRGSRSRGREQTGVKYMNVSLVSEMADVLAAIKTDEDLFLHYHIADV